MKKIFFMAVIALIIVTPVYGQVKQRKMESQGEVLKAKEVIASVEEEKVFDIVEQMPEFPGGPQALFTWLSQNVKYPAIAEENGVEGRVIVTFVVERDGSIADVRVVKSVDPSLDKEAVRVVKSMPRWIPGKHKGSAVRVKYTVPVTFKLAGEPLKNKKQTNSTYSSEQLQNLILKLNKEKDSIKTEYAILRRSIKLTDDELFSLSVGVDKYTGFGEVISGRKKYYYDLSYDDLRSYEPLNRSVVRVVANDVFGEVVNVDNLGTLLVNYYLRNNFDKMIKVGMKSNKVDGDIKYEQSLRRFADVLLCADISIKDEHLKLTRNRGLLYDIKNAKVLELADVLTSSAIKKYGLPQKAEDVSIKLKGDSLILTNYEKKPYNTVGIKVSTNKENLTSGFNNLLSECEKARNVERLQSLAYEYNLLKSKIDACQAEIERMKNNQNVAVKKRTTEFPKFPGGKEAQDEWILKNLKYPKESKNLKQFTVAINCFVEVDGSLTDVRVASRGLHDGGIDPAFGKEAIRIIESMPRWIPGQINGKNVRMQTKIFVTFTPPGSVVNANAKKANTTPQKVSDARLKQLQKEDGKIASFTFEDEADGEVLKAKEVITHEVEEEVVFDVVEQMPEFPGGEQALFTWLSQNIKYPAIAEENGVQGVVHVRYAVERDGSITDVKVMKSVDPALDKEAVRVIKSMPRWKPGKQKGETVRVRLTVPVTFRLQ